MTAALSRYAESTPAGFFACVLRIIANSDFGWRSPSMIQSALKILCRQCSEFACANIMSSTSVGSRFERREVLHQVIDLVVRQRETELGIRGHQCIATGGQRHGAQGARLFLDEEPRGIAALEQRRLGHAIEQRRREPRGVLARELVRRFQFARRRRVRCDARHRGRTRARCRWPCSPRERSCRSAAPP